MKFLAILLLAVSGAWGAITTVQPLNAFGPNRPIVRTVSQLTNALNYANLNASSSNRFLIEVGPGVYYFTGVDQNLIISNYVGLRGAGKYLTEFVTATDGAGSGPYIESSFIIPRGNNYLGYMTLRSTNRTMFLSGSDATTTLIGTLFDADTDGNRSKDTTNVVFEELSLHGVNALVYVHNNTAGFPFSVDWTWSRCEFFAPRDALLFSVDTSAGTEATYGFTPVTKVRFFDSYFRAYYNKLDPIYTNGMARAVAAGAHAVGVTNCGYLEFHDTIFDVEGGTTNSIAIIHGNAISVVTTNAGPGLKLFGCTFRVVSTNSPGSNNVYSVSNFLGRVESYGSNFGDDPPINRGGAVFISPERKTLLSLNSTVGNIGAGEDELHNVEIPKFTLNATNQVVTFSAAGTTAANSNTKRLRVRLGTAGAGTLILDAGAIALNAVPWRIEGSIQYITEASAKAWVALHTHHTNRLDYTALTIGWNTNITLRVSGEATSNNDVVCEASRVEHVGVGGF